MTQQRTTLVDLLFGRKKDSQEDTAIKARKIAVQCAKIAAQIRKGNKVDPEDLRYLRKHDPQLYLMAMTMRKPNDDPEKCKRISREDPSQNTVGSLQIVQHNSSGESVPVMPSQPKATE